MQLSDQKKKSSKKSSTPEEEAEALEQVVEQAKQKELTSEAIADLKQRAGSGDKLAADALEQIVVNFQAWQAAKTQYKRVIAECKDTEEQHETGFREAVEEEIPIQDSGSGKLAKLQRIEQRYTEWEDAKAMCKERKNEAKNRVKETNERLDRAVHESAQLALPGFG